MISPTSPSSTPPRAATATGCATSCPRTPAAPTASTAACCPAATSTEAAGARTDGLPPGTLLLVEGVGRGLPVREIAVGDRHRLAVLGRREPNPVDDLALTVIGLLDRVL